MKTLTMGIAVLIVLSLGCSSGQKTTGGGNQAAGDEKKSVDEGLMKKKEEEKRKEEQMAREELEKKKIENEKQKMELKAVKERLRNMGLGVTFSMMTRANEVFRYIDGHTVVAKEKVVDQGILAPLNELLSKQKEKSNEFQNEWSVCSGGFEACQGGRLYIYFMERDQNGACTGAWYLTDQECKP